MQGARARLAAEGVEGPDAELLLVRSLEWTTFLEGTADTALEQANVVLRYLLGAPPPPPFPPPSLSLFRICM